MAGLDFEKLKEVKKQIDKELHQEMMKDLSKDLINFVLDKDLKQSFTEEITRKKTNQTKRVINYWVSKGVIKAQQETDGGWFYFTRIESIWIDVAIQLREFGFDLNKLIKIREKLFEEVAPHFTLIEFMLMHSVVKSPYIMIINSTGDIKTLPTYFYSDYIKQEPLAPHLAFNFFYLAEQIFPNNNFHIVAKNQSTVSLSEKELKILYYIRTGDYKEIKVRKNDGETYLLEINRKAKVDSNIMNVIKNAEFQDIEIKTADSKIVTISATEKIKI